MGHENLQGGEWSDEQPGVRSVPLPLGLNGSQSSFLLPQFMAPQLGLLHVHLHGNDRDNDAHTQRT